MSGSRREGGRGRHERMEKKAQTMVLRYTMAVLPSIQHQVSHAPRHCRITKAKKKERRAMSRRGTGTGGRGGEKRRVGIVPPLASTPAQPRMPWNTRNELYGDSARTVLGERRECSETVWMRARSGGRCCRSVHARLTQAACAWAPTKTVGTASTVSAIRKGGRATAARTTRAIRMMRRLTRAGRGR